RYMCAPTYTASSSYITRTSVFNFGSAPSTGTFSTKSVIGRASFHATSSMTPSILGAAPSKRTAWASLGDDWLAARVTGASRPTATSQTRADRRIDESADGKKPAGRRIGGWKLGGWAAGRLGGWKGCE